MKRRVALSAFFACSLLQANQSLAQQTDGTVNLSEIIVTANKREQPLSKVDGSVSVKTAEELRRAGVTKVDELGKVFPGLVIRTRGNRVYSNFTVRGQYSPDFYNATVQIYVDGVPQDPSVFTQELLDVDRVEFLRGPQGTLYGRNAYGGVINIITKRAREERLSLSGTLSDHGPRGDIAGTTVLSADKLFFDYAARAEKDPGHIEDISTGVDDAASTRIGSGLLKLRYDPATGPFDATLGFLYDHVETNEELYLFDRFVDKRQFFSAIQPINYLNLSSQIGYLNWNYKGDNVVLSSTSSYQDVSYDRDVFGSMTPEAKQLASQEVKLSYEGGNRLAGVAGVYFQDEEFVRDVVGFSRNKVGGQSAAIFGEATFNVTEWLDVTGGLRYGRDEASIDFDAPGFFSFKNSAEFEVVLGKAAIGVQPSENLRLYGLISQGYKPGGFNHAVVSPDDAIAYEAETSVNYEIGMRASLFDEALLLSAAGYYIPSKDKQIYVGVVPFQVIRNVGESTSKGVEIEANLQATQNLQITAMMTAGRSTFDSYVDVVGAADNTGNRVPYAPDVTANVSARYVIPQKRIDGQLSVYGAAHYTSKIYFDEANTLSQPEVATFDASLELALSSGVTVSLFGTNLTDETYRTSSFNFGGVISTIGDGRVVGATVKATF